MASSEKEGQNTSDCQVQEQKQTLEEETLQVTSPSRPLCPGVAAIKSQYLVKQKHVDSSENSEGGSSHDIQPPPAKKRRRGQNKHRPRCKIPYSEQLCSSLHLRGGAGVTCPFGENCRYMHDVEKYMASKPEDLGDRCFLFETYGRCSYGPACRFGGSHLNARFENIVNEAIFVPDRPASTINVLSKRLQEQLRKRTLPFPRSDAYLRQLAKQRERTNSHKPSLSSAGVPSNKSALASADCSLQSSVTSSGSEMQCFTDSVANLCSSVPTTGSSNGPCFTESETSSVQSFTEKSKATVACDIQIKTCGAVTDEDHIKLRPQEKKKVDFRDKLFLAPLTTVGNLPFRRVCKEFGADITCGEMAMSTNLLQGQTSEWALLKRHESENVFGVQVCGSHADTMTRCAELLNTHTTVDFVDINTGCPIDLVFKKGAGCALMGHHTRFEGIVRGMVDVLDCPLTVKMRTGIYNKNWNAHNLIPKLRAWGVSMVTLHGRSREQRYTKMADWEYINKNARVAHPMPLFGNGDILSFEDYYTHRKETDVAGVMIARGALIKPWIFTEIKEQRHWDISSSERLEILRRYTNYGLEHWGSDLMGVENTRKFLLEWLSFLYRYIPVGLLERVPQKINERPPSYEGRDELETLMSSNNCQHWVKISEMLLGPVPQNFTFLPKHKANAYS